MNPPVLNWLWNILRPKASNDMSEIDNISEWIVETALEPETEDNAYLKTTHLCDSI